MYFRLNDDRVGFPDPNLAEPDGLLAVGGGMSEIWLVNAYCMGIFPWYIYRGMPHWYSPDPRMVLFPKEFHCSKSLRRQIHSGRFETRVDTCFREVIENCASVARSGDSAGSWIDEQFIDSYCKLHRCGYAHSFETFQDGKLVGGLYGVSVSDYFCGESMFHTVTDASKVAFARMVDFALMHDFRFIDTQLYTDHLASLGAREIPRKEFLSLLDQQDFNRTYTGRWRNNSVVLLLGGNQGNRVELLMKAVDEIGSRIGIVSQISPVYETEPWGFEAETPFLNLAVVVDTDKDAHEVLLRALEIEKLLGRKRPNCESDEKTDVPRYSSRPIDIDLIFYNSDIIDTSDLQLPHPRMHLRRFVLEPLSKIIPDFLHPKFHKTVTQLLQECEDKNEVRLFFDNIK